MARTKSPATKKTKTAPAKKTRAKAATASTKRKLPSLSLARLKKYLLPLGSAAVVAGLGVLWYFQIYTEPKNIFWGMVSNNLSTSSVSKVSEQESGSYVSSEVIQVTYRPQLAVQNLRDITDNTQQSPTRVKLEAIGTPETDYQRYLLINRKNASGKKLDYSRVYDKWLKSEGETSGLVNNQLFGPVLFGHLPQPVKESVMTDLKKAYEVNYGNVKKVNLDGRRTYVFDVEVGLSHYASAAQKYARALGLAVAEQIDPSSYSKDNKTKITVYVDALSRQVRRVGFQSTNSLENYTAYGIIKPLKPPAKTVTSEEFQKAINAVSEQ